MDKLNMHTPNLADENYKKLAALFPNAVTETIDPETGEVVRAIDKDILMQEINARVVEGREERYQFTWPDKKKAVLAANAPIAATLRPVRKDSVGRDGTPGGWDSENLYIEGDNLDVLKLLRETYLGKVKMIYIDPPYNTGNDFVYEDDFAEDAESYISRSGQYDEQGNRLVQNTESNGRFHTDWLNMIYPRLRIAKNLLSEDGLIFASIGDDEAENLKRIMSEIFGAVNFIAQINIVTGANQSGEGVLIQKNVEYCLVFAKDIMQVCISRVDKTEESWRNLNDAPTPLSTRLDMGYTIYYSQETGDMVPLMDYDKTLVSTDDESIVYKNNDVLIEKGYVPIRPGRRNGKLHRWRWGIDTFEMRKSEVRIFTDTKGKFVPKFLQSGFNAPKNIQSFSGGAYDLKDLFGNPIPFDYPKGLAFLKYLVSIASTNDSIVLDFFSGSATTAHAVMQLNAEDGGHRKFIMVQIPEACDEKSEAYKAGYKNICDIGKERIRRAGQKIVEEQAHLLNAAKSGALARGEAYAEFTTSEKARAAQEAVKQQLDIGFRVLRLDSSNMQDVYYTPSAMAQNLLDTTTDNIKPDRTPEDLLFQVMLELGVLPSSKIVEMVVDGKRVFDVADGFLLACFDDGVTSETVTAIAKSKPYYAVFRDSSMADDSVATNFDQIFETYSPSTVRKVL